MTAALNDLMIAYRDERTEEAFAPLYHKAFAYAIGVARNRRLVGDYWGEDDLAQEAMINIWRWPSAFEVRHENSFRNWLTTVIQQRAITKAANNRSVRCASLATTEFLAPYTTDPLPLEEICTILALALRLLWWGYEYVLTATERKAVAAVDLEGLSYIEASKRTGKQYHNFKMILCRARKKLCDPLVWGSADRGVKRGRGK